MKGIAGFAPDAFEIDLPLAEQIQVFLGKILADHTDNAHGSEKTRRQGKIGCRSPEYALRGPEGCFNGIKRNRTDNQNAHRYFPMIGRRSERICFGILVLSVIIASFSDDLQAQARASVKRATVRPMILWASATFCCSTARTLSISTSPAA